jgi:ABC-2 type transport system permease protein
MNGHVINIRGGWVLVKKSLFSYMSSRGFFWTLAISWMMGPLVYLFVWLTAAGKGTVGGFDRNDFILYYTVLIVINQITFPTSTWTTGENIRNGTISTWLLRPVPVIAEAIASDFAVKIVCLPFIIILTVLLGLLMGISLQIGTTGILVFIPALVMAWILRFTVTYIIAILAFWTQRIDSLLSLVNTFTFIFAGQVAPTVILPGILKHTAAVLPFRYMIGFPIEVLMGKLPPGETVTGLLIQFTWTAAAVVLYKTIWNRGVKAYTAIGG